MKTLSKERKKIRELKGTQKVQYIWDYYKAPLIVTVIVIYISGSLLHGHLTRKNNILYTAFVNVVTSDTLTESLSNEFMQAQNIDTSQNAFYLYKDLYLTDDETNPNHAYTYASRIKILGAIDSEKLDIVFMNQEAFDAFSQGGYLCNIEDLLIEKDPALFQNVESFLGPNEDYPTGIDLSAAPLIHQAGFQDTLYLGVIANSSRTDMATTYIKYLFMQ